ncbi:MAG: alpha/beta hydrolase [Acidobacteriota bacterium]
MTVLRIAAGARAVVLLAVVAAVGLVSLRSLSRNFIYLPWRWSELEARRWNRGYEEVWIEVPDGNRLHGWLYRGRRKDTAVLICHGNAGHLGVQEGLLAPYRSLGITALLFDYRGYGLSSGSPDEEGIAADALAALERLSALTGLGADRLVVHGKSLGGAPATRTAISAGTAGLVLESAFTSALDLGRHHYPFLPISWILEDHLDTLSLLGRLSDPVLILHGERDRIVPPVHARRLAEAAGSRAHLVLLPRSDHNNTFEAESEAFLEALSRYLDEVASPPARPGG